MSMYDKCWCGCDCPQKDCERNIKLNKEFEQYQYYTLSLLDEDNPDKTHEDCKYKLTKKG